MKLNLNYNMNSIINLITGRHRIALWTMILSLFWIFTACDEVPMQNRERKTVVSIDGEKFYINGEPTYKGRTWTSFSGETYPVEGLLMNSRMVQGIFDDLNPQTQGQWAYPDTQVWDPDRNTQEFIDAMASWKEHGLLSFVINLQGGCPYGYCRTQPWDNSAFASDGSLRMDYMNRLERILDHADDLGMVPMVGYFYFGQDENLVDEEAVKRAVVNATEWVLDKGYTNVIVEINNECNVRYDHDILKCDRVHELITLAKGIEKNGRRLYVSTSLGGGAVPPPNIVGASDFVLLHGNGVRNPERMVQMVQSVRNMDVYTPKPIVNNEDDQPWRVAEQGWSDDNNNFVACVKNYASWGYFDFRFENEHNDYNEGFQSVPVNWQITSERKRGFFDLLADITGSPGTPSVQIEWSPQEIGPVKVRLEGNLNGISVDEIRLLVNNRVVATAQQAPAEFMVEMPSQNHMIKAQVEYQRNDRSVLVESPMYKNPWWPYGGAAQAQ
jgi:hypothetical protein